MAVDKDKIFTYHEPFEETAKRYQASARKLWECIEKVNAEGGACNEAIQPTMGVNGSPSACSSK